MMNFAKRVRGIGAAGLVITAVSFAVGGSGSAGADNQICDKNGWTTIEGSYVVQNNRWGSTTATQCIDVTNTGFAITKLVGGNSTNAPPVGYPSVYLGCHLGNCSPGSSLPMQVSHISSATSSINFSYVDGGTYDAAYDIFLDPTPKTTGEQQMEIMIHLNRQGVLLPSHVIGTIGGHSWEIWQNTWQPGGPNEIIYAAPSPINAWDFSVLDFINDVRSRGGITDAWYLNSIQAGFECYSGCVGLAVNSFSAKVT
jgi:glycosyl hydrolase family 12